MEASLIVYKSVIANIFSVGGFILFAAGCIITGRTQMDDLGFTLALIGFISINATSGVQWLIRRKKIIKCVSRTTIDGLVYYYYNVSKSNLRLIKKHNPKAGELLDKVIKKEMTFDDAYFEAIRIDYPPEKAESMIADILEKSMQKNS